MSATDGGAARLARAGAIALATLCSACVDELPPLGQVVLHVDTDAALPQRTPSAWAPFGLFDTLVVDVYEPGATEPCGGCSRVFPLDDELLRERRASFGVPTAAGAGGYRVRLRMYWSGATLSGEPPSDLPDGSPPQSVVDVIAALPEVEREGIVHATVVLRTDDVGVPVGTLDAPVAAEPGSPAASRVGSWPGARRLPCAGAPGPGEVCIPGGAFWMGNPRIAGQGIGNGSDRLRLVVLSPFYLDVDETTVAAQRALGPADFAWSGGSTGSAWRDWCTFTDAPSDRDVLPLTCVSWDTARAGCAARGGDLPSEAQFEYVAGALSSRLFVWGSDEPDCDDAVLSRGGFGILNTLQGLCKPPEPPGGPLPVGSMVQPPRRDRLALDDVGVAEPPPAVVTDLVGNVTEWTLDLWQRQDEPCWAHGGVFVDPICQTPSPADGEAHPYRGGSWIAPPRGAAAAVRLPLATIAGGQGIDLGYRCARPAR